MHVLYVYSVYVFQKVNMNEEKESTKLKLIDIFHYTDDFLFYRKEASQFLL